MAKRKQKHRNKSKHQGGAGAGGAQFWAQLLRETLGSFAGQRMADGTEQMAKSSTRAAAEDLAADVLCVLAESGPKSIAELITETGAGLTPLLRALQQTREFGLIEMNGDAQAVQLMPCGSRTASALRREQINSDGMKRLES